MVLVSKITGTNHCSHLIEGKVYHEGPIQPRRNTNAKYRSRDWGFNLFH